MWILKKLDGEVYPLFTRSEHIIGRFGTLELSTDASVSRRHASITITLKKGTTKFILRDLGSKYGTYLNDGITSVTAMPKSTTIELKIGDRIKFGMQSNTWILEETRFVTCTSLLSSQDKTNLKNILSKLNGVIVSDWNMSCTHLTMSQIKTTIKAVCALAEVKPIVSLYYWEQLAAAFFGSVESPLPDCDDFLPTIAEPQIKSSLIDMKMNKNRRTIFEGFKFVVFGRAQMNNILPIVEAAGGTVVDGNCFAIKENELCKEKVIVVQDNGDEDSSSSIVRVTNILNSKGLRLIKDTEIYLSIFECSTERHCNPRFDASVLLLPSESPVNVKEEDSVLALETQDSYPDQETQFMETASGNFSLAVNERIVISESDDDDIIPGTDPSIIYGTPPPFATKRKLPDVAEDVTKVKSARLDSWLLRNQTAQSSSKDSVESSASESIFSTSSKMNRKNFKDLFGGIGETKKVGHVNKPASGSLFGSSATTDSSPSSSSTSVGAIGENKLVSHTGALFGAAAGDKRVSHTASLFASVNASRVARNSGNLFSGANEETPSTATATGCATSDRSAVSSKRKCHDDEVDGEIKCKNRLAVGSRTASLFQRQMKRPTVVPEKVDSNTDDESNGIAARTSKLTLAKNTPLHQDSPSVDVPSMMSLSQFQGAPARENMTVVKTEAISPRQEELEKSVIYTLPLVRSNGPNIQHRPVDSSVKNFKPFRKNEVRYPSSVFNGTKLILVSGGGIQNGFHD